MLILHAYNDHIFGEQIFEFKPNHSLLKIYFAKNLVCLSQLHPYFAYPFASITIVSNF